MIARPSHCHSALARELEFSRYREDDCVGENSVSNRRGNSSRPAGEADTNYVSQRRDRKEPFAIYTHCRGVEEYPAQFTISLIQGKWKTQILSRLQHGPVRLSQLRKMVAYASKKMLTQHLREMEEDRARNPDGPEWQKAACRVHLVPPLRLCDSAAG